VPIKLMDLKCAISRKCKPGNTCHPEAITGMNIHFPTTAASSSHAMALFPAGTPTLEGVLSRLFNDASLPATRRRDFVSAVRRVAKALGLPPSQIPADPTFLRRKLSSLLPPQLGKAAKTKANVLSNAMGALAQAGVATRRPRGLPMSLDWQELWDRLPPRLKMSLSSFMRFCSHRQIAPCAVAKRFDQMVHELRDKAGVTLQPGHVGFQIPPEGLGEFAHWRGDQHPPFRHLQALSRPSRH